MEKLSYLEGFFWNIFYFLFFVFCFRYYVKRLVRY